MSGFGSIFKKLLSKICIQKSALICYEFIQLNHPWNLYSNLKKKEKKNVANTPEVSFSFLSVTTLPLTREGTTLTSGSSVLLYFILVELYSTHCLVSGFFHPYQCHHFVASSHKPFISLLYSISPCKYTTIDTFLSVLLGI